MESTPCTCPACQAKAGVNTNAAQSPDPTARRAVVIAGAALLLAPLTRWARAADDLLDPSKIGVTRKSVQSEGLLDPDSIGAKVMGAGGAPVRRRSGRQSPSDARNMAASVVSSVAGLINTAGKLMAEADKLAADISRLRSKLDQLIQEKAFKLDEYRNGLFCSGCNQTKSEILAKGETFPHSGQHIIRATPEQIAAKERELQAPIDRTEKELKDTAAKHVQVVAQRDEALDQVGAGLALWRTSVSFETDLIELHEQDSLAAYKAEYDQADAQYNRLQPEIKAAKDPARKAALDKESKLWSELMETLESRRKADRRAYANARDKATATHQGEAGRLADVLSTAKLNFQFAGVYYKVGPSQGLKPLGGYYRMGDHNPARHGEVLSRVSDFIERFNNQGK
jgi:hypothetical protein